MARRVFLHVGPAKTGTSFLQETWWRHRSTLEEHGLLYPGRHWMAHFHAASVVCENPYQLRHMPPRARRAWDWITDEVAKFEGDAILSSERFAGATPEQAEQALRRLEQVADEVHVLATARDLARQLPSGWQQHVRSGGDLTLDEWWRGLDTDKGSRYWRSQDLAGLLDRWSSGLVDERIHVVVHAQPGAPERLLWERVCAVLGMDPGLVEPIRRMNPSLGANHVELLRRVNATLPPERNPGAVGAFTKGVFAGQIVTAQPSPPFVLPVEAHAWCVRRAEAMVSEIRARGYDVCGSLDDLVPAAEPRVGITPQDVSDDDLLELALRAMGRTLMEQKKMFYELERLRREKRAGAATARRQSVPQGARRAHGPRRLVRRLRRLAGGRRPSATGTRP